MVDEADTPDEELEAGDEAAQKKGGMMKIMLIVNAAFLLIAIIVGATWFILAGDKEEQSFEKAEEDIEVLAPATEEAAPEVAAEATSETGKRIPIYVPLKPSFVVNFENQEQVSFLQVDIQIMTYDARVEKAIDTHMPVVRNELLLLLGGKQYHEINTREGKRQLSEEAMNEIIRVLDQAGAPSSVEALYFTSFVMQ